MKNYEIQIRILNRFYGDELEFTGHQSVADPPLGQQLLWPSRGFMEGWIKRKHQRVDSPTSTKVKTHRQNHGKEAQAHGGSAHHQPRKSL